MHLLQKYFLCCKHIRFVLIGQLMQHPSPAAIIYIKTLSRNKLCESFANWFLRVGSFRIIYTLHRFKVVCRSPLSGALYSTWTWQNVSFASAHWTGCRQATLHSWSLCEAHNLAVDARTQSRAENVLLMHHVVSARKCRLYTAVLNMFFLPTHPSCQMSCT